MHRLLQGEVGSGKTVVALRAMLTVVDAGGQAALLAPTEVLAQQHFRSITSLMGELAGAGTLGSTDQSTSVVLLTGSTPAATRKKVLADIASGTAGIIIGTSLVVLVAFGVAIFPGGDEPAEKVAAKAERVVAAMHEMGCTLNNAYMQHSLLALVVIPSLRISDVGLIDVTAFAETPLFVDDGASA